MSLVFKIEMGDSMDNQKIAIDEILGNDVKINSKKDIQEDITLEETTYSDAEAELNQDYEYIHSGEAMNERELLHFSSRNKVQLVLVAGPYESGKTTLMVMMYHLFREGLNKDIAFKSSYTMKGYWKRSDGILLNSGNGKLKTERTYRTNQDLFLNLEIVNEKKQVKNLIFTDISGELFSDVNFLKDLPDYFVDSRNVILVMDGHAMGDVTRRRGTIHDLKIMLGNLIKYEIITKRTNLQVVCTKMDMISIREDSAECEKYIISKYEEIKNAYGQYVAQMNLYKISALSLQEPSESKVLEQIIKNCMEEKDVQLETNVISHRILERSFDRYGLRD